MANSSMIKDRKYMPPIQEIAIVDNQATYPINSSSIEGLEFLSRKPNEKFYIMVKDADYTLEQVSGVWNITIINTDLLEAITDIQVASALTIESGEYDPIGSVDIVTLKDYYNKLYRDFINLQSFYNINSFLTDGLTDNLVLPSLKPNETWVMNVDGEVVTTPIGVINDSVEKLLEDFKKELDDFTEEQKVELDIFNEEQKTELNNFTEEQKTEVIIVADAKIEEINNIILDNAGNGLVKVGNSINVGTANDALIINEDSIELNVVDDLETPSSTRAISARQAVILKADIDQNKSDILLKTDSGGYNGTSQALKNEIDSKGYSNFKGEYNPATTYVKNDVVYMKGHEQAYIHEFTDVGFSDPTRYTETRKDYQIQDVMYYRYDGTKWEIIFDESHEVNLNLYTIAHQPPTQNYVSTWDNYFPYSDIGRWLCNKDVGTPIKKLDKVDSSKYEDGTASDWTGSSGDIMVKIPKFYCNYTFTSKGRRIRFYSYNNPVGKVALDSYVHPAFDFENKIAENIFIGATKGVIIGNQLRSCIGGVANTKTKASFLDLARQGRNVNYTLNTFSNMNLVRDLFLMEFGNTNSQDVVGNGRVNTTSAVNSGVTKILGDRSGRYNTDVSNGNVSYRGLEDWWGNIWEFLNGLLVDDSGYYYTNNVLKMDDISKMTKLSVGTILTGGNSFIREYAKIEDYPHIGVPVKTGASATTYYCDNFWYHNAGQENIAIFGASWSIGLNAGASCLDLSNSAPNAYSNFGARLAFYV